MLPSAPQATQPFGVAVAVVERRFDGGVVVAGFFQNLKARGVLGGDNHALGRAREPRHAQIAEHHGRRATIGHEVFSFKISQVGLSKFQRQRGRLVAHYLLGRGGQRQG
ncbi:hypothetical protein EON79_11635 [bacterium]|nr:MAG: hypothetical protein EON79_11635 [bacterium]